MLCKFYYYQVYESLYRKWLVHPWGQFHNELDQYDSGWISHKDKIGNKKILNNAKNNIDITEKLRSVEKVTKTIKTEKISKAQKFLGILLRK